jgi:hypothetical protein
LNVSLEWPQPRTRSPLRLTPRRRGVVRNQPLNVRLPVPGPNPVEDRVYALLAALCLLTLGYELYSLGHSAARWHAFVSYVRQLLS